VGPGEGKVRRGRAGVALQKMVAGGNHVRVIPAGYLDPFRCSSIRRSMLAASSPSQEKRWARARDARAGQSNPVLGACLSDGRVQ
jgi:hypothetical protein